MNTVELYIAKADETLLEAKLMLQNGFYSGTVSRAYYAAFHSIQALLENIDISVKTHQGVLMMFSKHFIKTEIFPKQIVKFLKQNLDKRLLGDYEVGFKATDEDALLAVEHAEKIVITIKIYLNL